MKTDFNRPFKDLFGNDVTDKNGKPVMIGRSLGLQLFNLGEMNGKTLTPEEKYMAYTLSVRLANKEEIELSKEEADFISKVAAQFYTAGAYGNIKDILTQNQ